MRGGDGLRFGMEVSDDVGGRESDDVEWGRAKMCGEC
jgi:hypothetical protein